MNGKKETMTGRTATKWLQYLEMVDILRRFLKVERTGIIYVIYTYITVSGDRVGDIADQKTHAQTDHITRHCKQQLTPVPH